MAAPAVVNPHIVAKLKSYMEDPSYKEAIEQSSNYNARLSLERRLRLPFLDSQTGVAQNHCNLWMNRRQRMPGQYPGQLYSYPVKRWRKKRRQYLLNERVYTNNAAEVETTPEADVHQISMVENVGVTKVESQSNEEVGNERLAALLSGGTVVDDTSKESWYKDFEDASEPPDAGEIEDPDSDFEDYEETYIKKKKKKIIKTPRGRGRKIERNPDGSEVEKPYCCEVCGTRYKTRPGLSYHYSHSHCGTGGSTASSVSHHAAANPPGIIEPKRDVPHQSPFHLDMMTPQAAPPTSIPSPNPSSVNSIVSQPEAAEPPVPPSSTMQSSQQSPATSADDPLAGQRSASGKPLANPSPYCDFCLGDHSENKKTGRSEELVSCADCGRSGHPSCLQFTVNMVQSVKKYRWQCIECKSCGLCGTSDNDVCAYIDLYLTLTSRVKGTTFIGTFFTNGKIDFLDTETNRMNASDLLEIPMDYSSATTTFQLLVFASGWARRPSQGKSYGRKYIEPFKNHIDDMFMSGIEDKSNKTGPGRMLEQLRLKYPDRLDLPSESEIRQLYLIVVRQI
ncbi:Zinc finger protein neuro-d4 [Nymphon striatum]|nr:Zinc finger protein neuro-d4 [Nymphon striatum]